MEAFYFPLLEGFIGGIGNSFAVELVVGLI
jgi:hypothetical protein